MNILKRQVTHRKYGSGTVTGFRDNVVTVFFDQYGSHSFRYPDAFADEMRAVDAEVQRSVESEMAQ